MKPTADGTGGDKMGHLISWEDFMQTERFRAAQMATESPASPTDDLRYLREKLWPFMCRFEQLVSWQLERLQGSTQQYADLMKDFKALQREYYRTLPPPGPDELI